MVDGAVEPRLAGAGRAPRTQGGRRAGNPTAPVDVLAVTTTPQELPMIRILILMTAVLGLSACETFGGFGRDVSTAGQAVTNTAQDVEDELD